MPFTKGNEIGKATRWQRGVSPNPGGRPTGALNPSTKFKTRVLSRIEDVLCDKLDMDEFVAEFAEELGRLIKKSPILALRETRFLWPTEPAEETRPAVFNISQERFREIVQASVASVSPPLLPATDALSDAAGQPRETPSNLNGDETESRKTSAPPVEKNVEESQATAPPPPVGRVGQPPR